MTIVLNMQNTPQNTLEKPVLVDRPLRDYVKSVLTHYLEQLDGQDIVDLHQFVLAEVEAPLMEVVMHYTRGNQSKAAVLLGISRSTLRKKLKQYDLEGD